MPPHPRIGSDQTVAYFGASHKQPTAPGRSFGHFFHLRALACPLPTTASHRRSPWEQAPYGQRRYGVLSFQVSRTICGHHQPSATMETGMRFQADIDALRLRQHRQLSRPGRPPAPACHRWRLSAAHQMRPPCGAAVDRYYEAVAFRMRP